MNKLVATLGFFALTTLGFLPTADASSSISLGGGMGSQAFGMCTSGRNYWSDEVVHQTGPFTLAPGTYHPHMGRTTVWQVKKIGTDTSIPFMGELRLEVIEVAIFGGETVLTAYNRSVDTSGVFGGVADNQEFGSFVVPANVTSSYIVRVTASAGPCSQAYMKNVRVELITY